MFGVKKVCSESRKCCWEETTWPTCCFDECRPMQQSVLKQPEEEDDGDSWEEAVRRPTSTKRPRRRSCPRQRKYSSAETPKERPWWRATVDHWPRKTPWRGCPRYLAAGSYGVQACSYYTVDTPTGHPGHPDRTEEGSTVTRDGEDDLRRTTNSTLGCGSWSGLIGT